jgi:hypothetical protein
MEIKRQKNIDRHGPRTQTNTQRCHLPHTPSFSLQTTFKPNERGYGFLSGFLLSPLLFTVETVRGCMSLQK